MIRVLIALGANLAPPGGTPAATLAAALDRLGSMDGIAVRRRSRWFSTPAFPPGSGPDFVNGAAALETALEPEPLLAALHAVEAEFGRVRPARWVPRLCDIDLIGVGDRVLPDAATARRWMALDQGEAQRLAPPRLILPHPRMHERGFVLVPLADVAPDWRHPLSGLTVREMLAALPAAERAAIRPLPP
jgi:2-amino-4-hydroxy-6-hydroxymethyldihydropteridine diphosphokinase